MTLSAVFVKEVLVKERAIHIRHIQKNFEVMNPKFCTVITGITGMTIIPVPPAMATCQSKAY